MKKINILGALVALALMLGLVVPAQAQPAMPFDEEQLKEIQEWAMSLGDEFYQDKPWEVGQSADFVLRFEGDIPDMPLPFKEIPINLAITGTEDVGGETYHWLEIVVPEMDFAQTGEPSTYKLGLLVKQMSKEQQKEMAAMQMSMQKDPMQAIGLLKDVLARVRFQQNSDPGMFLNLASIWPMIDQQSSMMKEMMAEMEEEEAGDEMDKMDFSFEGDHGRKSVTTPAGSFDANWMGMKMAITQTEENESVDVNFDGYYTPEVPIVCLAKFSVGLVPHGIEDFSGPVTIAFEAQKIGSGATTSFVNVDEFEDMGMMLGMMMGGMMGGGMGHPGGMGHAE